MKMNMKTRLEDKQFNHSINTKHNKKLWEVRRLVRKIFLITPNLCKTLTSRRKNIHKEKMSYIGETSKNQLGLKYTQFMILRFWSTETELHLSGFTSIRWNWNKPWKNTNKTDPQPWPEAANSHQKTQTPYSINQKYLGPVWISLF